MAENQALDLFKEMKIGMNNQIGPLVVNDRIGKPFWDRSVKKEPVIIHNISTVVTATKNLIAGILNKQDNAEISDLALKLAFYAVDGDDACFVYDKVLTFITSNLSEKLFGYGAPNGRKVSLQSNGWFDQWMKFPSSENFSELDLMINYLEHSINNVSISYFGPWFATAILSLSTETPQRVATNISKLLSRLTCLYKGIGCKFPKFEIESWQKYLQSIQIQDLDESKKNSLFWAIINVYHGESSSKEVQYFLDTAIMPSLRYRNMELITLIHQFEKVLSCGNFSALKGAFMLSADTIRSCENYIRIKEKYFNLEVSENTDDFIKFWPYCREFDSTVLMNVSYEENAQLCNVLAMIIDLSISTSYGYSKSDIMGPTLKNLVYNHKDVVRVTKMEFQFSKEFYELFKKKQLEALKMLYCSPRMER